MTETFSGSYPIESRAGEIERLLVQGRAMAPDTDIMLDLIGVRDGWHCLDFGCGPLGITDLLATQAGSNGRVVGLDMNAGFLDFARANAPPGVVYLQGDAYRSEIEPASFDLVHMRFVASTSGEPEALLEEAIRLARPGGIIALQEPDGSTLNCHPPHPDWDRLKAALLGAFRGVGADLELARRLYALLYASGLVDVQYRTFIVAVRSTDSMVDYLPATVESLKHTVVDLGLIPEDEFAGVLSRCRQHLATPGTSFTMYTVAQVWGRKP